MTREDIIRLAREAGLTGLKEADVLENFGRFAALVAAVEREACAKVCDAYAESHGCSSRGSAALDLADTIRKRGEVKP